MLKVDTVGPVLSLTLARPEVRNAINDELIKLLTDQFQSLAAGIRVIVLKGEGKSFCSGGDLDWMKRAANYTDQQNMHDAVKLATLFESMLACPAVIIAQIHGAAFGGGSGLVAAADVGIAAHGTQFAFSEVRLGLIPATISPFVISKIGQGHARALFTTGEAFDDERALRIGLIHERVAPEALEATVESKITAILRNGPNAVAMSKEIAIHTPKRKQESAKLLARARAGAEGKEGVAAFLEKRTASFVVER